MSRIYAPMFEEPATDIGKVLVCWADGYDFGEIYFSLQQAETMNPVLVGAE